MLGCRVYASVSYLHADDSKTSKTDQAIGFLFVAHFVQCSIFNTSTTIAELPSVFVQLFPSFRHRKTDVNNLTAGCCPVDPYVFTGMDQDYESCSVAFKE